VTVMVKRQPRPAAVLYYHDHCQTYQVSYAGDLTTVDALTIDIHCQRPNRVQQASFLYGRRLRPYYSIYCPSLLVSFNAQIPFVRLVVGF